METGASLHQHGTRVSKQCQVQGNAHIAAVPSALLGRPLTEEQSRVLCRLEISVIVSSERSYALERKVTTTGNNLIKQIKSVSGKHSLDGFLMGGSFMQLCKVVRVYGTWK